LVSEAFYVSRALSTSYSLIVRLNRYRRKIHFGSAVWTYRITGGSIYMRTPDLTVTHVVDMSMLTGHSWETLERAVWKKTSQANIKPSMVRDWIKANYI
jgi:carboxylesterase type B